MALVVDAAFVLSLAQQRDALFDPAEYARRLEEDGGFAPALWRLEVANALLVAVRRGRISAAIRAEILSDLSLLPIVLDDETATQAWTVTLELAEAHGLTVYDAAYLELAVRLQATLATRDQSLARAAREMRLEILG
jgi:predicted nucleic acid-binding protein